MADHDGLRIMADRIRARAVRRTGELLKQFNNTRARTDLDRSLSRSYSAMMTATRCTNALKKSAHAQLRYAGAMVLAQCGPK